jgi:hypothetical protein
MQGEIRAIACVSQCVRGVGLVVEVCEELPQICQFIMYINMNGS